MAEQLAQRIRVVGEALLADLDGLVSRRLADPAPPQGYRGVPDEVLASMVRGTYEWIIRAVLVDQRDFGPQEREFLERAVATRLTLGIPGEAILESFPGTLQFMWDEAAAEARRRRAGPAVMAALGSRIFGFGNQMSAVAARAIHRHQLAETRAEDRRRGQVFERLTFGGGAEAAELATFGIHAGQLYLGVRARAASDEAALAVERTLLDVARREGGVVGRLEGDAAGVLARPPRSTAAAAAIGVGPRVQLADIGRSLALASRAADTAVALGLDGVYSVDDLRLRCPLVSETEIGATLIDRYLKPLDALGAFGDDVIYSLRAFLDHGLRIDPTARALGIHPNTLRHRLERFEQLTGADLKRVEDIVELWWALARRKLAVPTDADSHWRTTEGLTPSGLRAPRAPIAVPPI